IALTISDFHVESATFCMYDYLKLFMDGTQKGPFCGDRTIPFNRKATDGTKRKSTCSGKKPTSLQDTM
ncbi:hypothetical protein AB205_0033480, partial [Aquarana catesbeiana]